MLDMIVTYKFNNNELTCQYIYQFPSAFPFASGKPHDPLALMCKVPATAPQWRPSTPWGTGTLLHAWKKRSPPGNREVMLPHATGAETSD
jgi:hypothetical protein